LGREDRAGSANGGKRGEDQFARGDAGRHPAAAMR